jgi:hypothetical protein
VAPLTNLFEVIQTIIFPISVFVVSNQKLRRAATHTTSDVGQSGTIEANPRILYLGFETTVFSLVVPSKSLGPFTLVLAFFRAGFLPIAYWLKLFIALYTCAFFF